MESVFAKSSGRVDAVLASLVESSRSQVAELVKKGGVFVNGACVKKASFGVAVGDAIAFMPLEAERSKSEFAVDFDVEVIYEDDEILVLDKPCELVVHAAPGVREATLVDWLKERGTRLSTLAGEERHGIVHRLDRGTSGVMVVAKNNKSHENLSFQLQAKTMGRIYVMALDAQLKEACVVERAIGRHVTQRVRRMALVGRGVGVKSANLPTGFKEAKTAFFPLVFGGEFGGEFGGDVSQKNENLKFSSDLNLVFAKLFTGRTHQIRAHLASVGRHILGDETYGYKGRSVGRVFLHAFLLYLKHPKGGEMLCFRSKIPYEFGEIKFENDEVFSFFDTCERWKKFV